MKLLAGRNYAYNQTIPLPTGLVNGQALGAVSGVKFGVKTVARNGCGVLAICNALTLCGMNVPLAEVAYTMERYRVLWGLFGVNCYALGHALRQWKIQSKRLRSRQALQQALAENRVCLLAYWTGKPLCSTVHIVCLYAAEGGQATVFNLYNRCSTPQQQSVEKLCQKRRMVAAYAVLSHELHREEEDAS